MHSIISEFFSFAFSLNLSLFLEFEVNFMSSKQMLIVNPVVIINIVAKIMSQASFKGLKLGYFDLKKVGIFWSIFLLSWCYRPEI